MRGSTACGGFSLPPTVGSQVDLAVSATATATSVEAFEAFSYVATVSNLTPTAAVATLTVSLPPNLRFDGRTLAALCTQTSSLVTCDIGTLVASQATEVRIQVTPQMVGTATATFVVSSPEADRNPSDNTATVAVASTLVIHETITVSDTVDPRPAVQVSINETIQVTDTVDPRLAVQLSINETIHVTDDVPPIATTADLSVGVVVAPGHDRGRGHDGSLHRHAHQQRSGDRHRGHRRACSCRLA